MNKVVMYKKDPCPYCVKAEAYLKAQGVKDIEFIDIVKNPEQRGIMQEKSGGRMTVPQIFIHGKHVGGCDDLLAMPLADLKKLLGN